MIPRFKVICLVHIGQLGAQGLRIGSRCLWDEKFDTFSTFEFRNNSIFAVGSVYGIYYEWNGIKELTWNGSCISFDINAWMKVRIMIAFGLWLKHGNMVVWTLYSNHIYSVHVCLIYILHVYFHLMESILSFMYLWLHVSIIILNCNMKFLIEPKESCTVLCANSRSTTTRDGDRNYY